MRKLIFSMTVSLDGYIAGPGGDIAWSAPDEELFRFHTDQVRELGGQICGRGLYETMLYWDTPAAREPALPSHTLEFTRVWSELPKYVFSRTLDSVEGNWTLLKGDLRQEVERLKREDGPPLEAGGADLAGSLMQMGLIDEYRLFIGPVLLGGGTRCFPALEHYSELALIETRAFSSGQVIYTRYARA
jgi:dihydrofolate reductase